MEEGRQTSPAPVEEPARLRSQIEELQEEVLRLQHKLGEIHDGDYNALRRAYTSLCQHVSALEQEAEGMVAQLKGFETAVVPPELVAKELGVAAIVTFGVALLHTTFRAALPIKGLGKGLWLLGGAFVLARLTGGALAHMAGMFGRNASRKRRLLRKLEAVEERITIMSALQQWAEKQQAQQALPEATEEAAAGVAAGAGPSGWAGRAGAGGEEEALPAVAPPRRVSPAASSGSSVEMVEMPSVEELEAAEAGEAGGHLEGAHAGGGAAPARPGAGEEGEEEASVDDPAGGSSSPPRGRSPTPGGAGHSPSQPGGGSSSGSGGGGDTGLLGLKAYVELGQKK